MPPVITTVTTTGHIGAAFTISGSGFGALAGLLFIFPNTDGEYNVVFPDTWSDTSITGFIPDSVLVPADAAFFLVLPQDAVVGAKSLDFPLLAALVVAAPELVSGEVVFVPVGTVGQVDGDPFPIPGTNRGEPAGLLTFVDTGGGTADGRWAMDVTLPDDYQNVDQVPLAAMRVRGSMTKAQQVALGNAFYGGTFIID